MSPAMVLITPLMCWTSSYSNGGCVYVAVVGVFVYLSLSLFFCLLPGSYFAPLGVLQVLLLLGDCLVS